MMLLLSNSYSYVSSEEIMEQTTKALGQALVTGFALKIIMIALGVFLAVILVKLVTWLVKLPFKLFRALSGRSSSKWEQQGWQFNSHTRQWDAVYAEKPKKKRKPKKYKSDWEFNEVTGLWEPKDKSRILK